MREKRKIEKTLLPNGITVLTEEIPHTYSIAGGVYVKVGSRHELPDEEGISHFIEHMLFKGTTKRDALSIAKEMDAIGGTIDAFTSKEFTCYYFKVLPHNLKRSLELIADMLLNPVLSEEDVEKEKEVVIQEILSVEDTPEEYVQELMFCHFFKGHPLSRFLLGTVDSVKAFSRSKAVNFMKSHYHPGNFIISGAGNISHNEFVQLVWENFKDFIPGIISDGFSKISFNPEKLVVVHKPFEQVHLCVGLEGTRYGERWRYPLSLFSTIFGTSNSSRLFQEIREKRGWAYDIYSFTHSYGDTGVFGIYLATKKAYINDVIKIIIDQLTEIREKGFKEEELQIAKDHLVSSFLISSENTDVSMLRLSKNYIYTGNLVSCKEVVDNIKGVENEDLREVAKRLLNLNRATFVLLGDVEEETISDIF
mgnify:CR=1 FL=1